LPTRGKAPFALASATRATEDRQAALEWPPDSPAWRAAQGDSPRHAARELSHHGKKGVPMPSLLASGLPFFLPRNAVMGLTPALVRAIAYLASSLKVATRLNSTCSKSLSVSPQPLVSRRSAEILYFFTRAFLTAAARSSDSFWFSSVEPSGEA